MVGLVVDMWTPGAQFLRHVEVMLRQTTSGFMVSSYDKRSLLDVFVLMYPL